MTEFDQERSLKFFALVTIVSVFVSLFVYFAIFPIQVEVPTETVQKTMIGIEPLSFEIAKTWNNLNPNETVIQIDSCNTATRIDGSTWQVTMKNC